MAASSFRFYIELHNRVQEVAIGKVAPHQQISQDALRTIGGWMTAVKQDGDESGLDAWVLHVLAVAEEGDADLYDLLALLGRQDMRQGARDELEVVGDVL